MEIYWILGGVVAVLAAWLLLSRVTARGGEKRGDASKIVGSVIDQSAAFRGDDPESRQPWDGVDRQKTGPGDPGGGL